jgi:hypothetical protein
MKPPVTSSYVASYAGKTSCLTLRERHEPRVTKNMALRRVSESKEKEATGDLRKLRNEELCNLYSSPNIIRTMKLRRVGRDGHVTRTGEKRNA